jgi:hypothetical protein
VPAGPKECLEVEEHDIENGAIRPRAVLQVMFEKAVHLGMTTGIETVPCDSLNE